MSGSPYVSARNGCCGSFLLSCYAGEVTGPIENFMKHPVMDLVIRTTSNEVIELQPNNTSVVLPGSNVWSAEGDFGTISIEELNTGPFTIRFTLFRLLKKLTAHFSTETPAICTRIATKNDWQFSLGASNDINLSEGQFTLYRLHNTKEKIVFDKGEEYRSFDAICPPEKVNGLSGLFPQITDFVNIDDRTKSAFMTNKTNWAMPEIMDIVKDIPDCTFENHLRTYYVEHRLEQLLFLMLTTATKIQTEESAPTPAEIKAANLAEKIILADLTKHHSIPAIARLVHLNEFRLKYVFKHLYKLGMFEYLLQARMEKAKRLLMQTDMPLKEIATSIGYQRLTSFIVAFNKYYGYTVRSVKRSCK